MVSNNQPSTKVGRLLPEWLSGWWGVLGLVAVIYFFFCLGLFYIYQNSQLPYFKAMFNLAGLPLQLLIVLMAGRVAFYKLLSPTVRRVWLIWGLAFLANFIAEGVWFYLADLQRVEAFPSLADVFYLSFYILILGGLFLIPGQPLNRRERWQYVLNLAMLMISAMMYLWYFVIRPTAAIYEGNFLNQALAVAYPIGDLVIIGGLLFILFRRTDYDTHSAMLIFLVGMSLFVVADTVFAYIDLTSDPMNINPIYFSWDAAYVFFIFAALRQRYVSVASARQPGWMTTVLDSSTKWMPFLTLVVAYTFVLYVSPLGLSSVDMVALLIAAILLTFLLIVQQIVAPGFDNLSLRTKLLLACLGITIFSVGTITLVTNYMTRTQIADQTGKGLYLLTKTKSEHISELLTRQIESLQSLILSQNFRGAVEAAVRHRTSDPTTVRERIQTTDRQWNSLPDNDPQVVMLLGNLTSRNLREWQENFPSFSELFVINSYGEVIGVTQRPNRYDYSDQTWWQAAYNGQQPVYISQPEFDSATSELRVIIAMPVRSHANQQVIGVVAGAYRLSTLIQGLSSISVELGEKEHVHILLPNAQLLASNGEVEPLEPDQLKQLSLLAQQPSSQVSLHENTISLVSQAPILDVAGTETKAIQALNWTLLVDQDIAEANAPITRTTQIALLASLGSLLLAGLLAFVIARLLTTPIMHLTTVAAQISEGDLSAQALEDSTDEIGVLGKTFNAMTQRLQQTLTDLEDRSQHLETVADLGKQFSSILNLEKLLAEVVNQIKDKFNYYHAHIYLLDDKREKLVVTAGTGAAGTEMKARGHSIRLDAPTSLVARAARTGQVVRVDNVRQDPAWLPNQLLPDTQSEMVVPILLEEQVVGVLDVQSDKMAGLAESDDSMLRSLANHLAVAIRNARQFAQVEAALAEARELQTRYVVQSWDKTSVVRKGPGRVQFSLGESTTLNEEIIVEGRQVALASEQATLATFNNSQKASTLHALVAPIKLRNVPIGNLQLHDINPDRHWTEGELTLIYAVIDQVAQVAETLRLLDETQERASREQLISQISNKMRRAPDIESLMQVAVTELSRALEPARTFVHMGLKAEETPAEKSTANGKNGLDQPT